MAEGGDCEKSDGSSPVVTKRRQSSSDEENTGGDDDQDFSFGLGNLAHYLKKTLNITSKTESSSSSKLLQELSLLGVAEYIKSGQCSNVIVMAGAGISTSAGIPDFRSPDSGLYANLAKYNLPDPQCIFEISFFKKDPRPFYSLAKELFPAAFKPTYSHYFVRLLHEKGLLLRLYTQNIDTLERLAGIPDDKIVEAHGTFFTSHCLGSSCRRQFSLEWMKEQIFSDSVPKCPDCNSYVKPDVVFFGENLPSRFFHLSSQDFPKCDLLIIVGTSLIVQPFASLIDRVPEAAPRLLINKEKSGEGNPLMRLLGCSSGLDFDSDENYRDVAWLGLCDDGCRQLAEHLGWTDEIDELQKLENEKQQKHH